jgi:hypothetical protein
MAEGLVASVNVVDRESAYRLLQRRATHFSSMA